MAPVCVVAGANRGIGLALCRQLRSSGYSVFGTSRRPSPKLEALGVHVVAGVDVGRDGGCAALTAALESALSGEQRVSLLVCNAGVLVHDKLEGVDIDAIREQFEVNTLGPLRAYLAVKGQLAADAKIAIVSSRFGSIGDNSSSGDYGYRMSKAAANMLGKNLAVDLKAQGVAVGILHPGMVQTDMTAGYHAMAGMISPDESAADLLSIIQHKLTLETSGTFWHRNGTVLPW